MSLINPACQICAKSSEDLVTCPNCKSRYYCSKTCQENDNEHLCKELKENLLKITDEKKQNGLYLVEQFNKNYQLLINDLRAWRTIESYKTGILTQYAMIIFADDGVIATLIRPLGKINAKLYWPNIDPKKSIPVRLCGKDTIVAMKLNL